MTLEIASLLLIVFAVIIIVWGIAVVHTLAGKIAAQAGHSQVKAIEITSYLGLLVFPLWMAALIWAYIVPLKVKATVELEKGASETPPKNCPPQSILASKTRGIPKEGRTDKWKSSSPLPIFSWYAWYSLTTG